MWVWVCYWVWWIGCDWLKFVLIIGLVLVVNCSVWSVLVMYKWIVFCGGCGILCFYFYVNVSFVVCSGFLLCRKKWWLMVLDRFIRWFLIFCIVWLLSVVVVKVVRFDVSVVVLICCGLVMLLLVSCGSVVRCVLIVLIWKVRLCGFDLLSVIRLCIVVVVKFLG